MSMVLQNSIQNMVPVSYKSQKGINSEISIPQLLTLLMTHIQECGISTYSERLETVRWCVCVSTGAWRRALYYFMFLCL